MIYTPDQSTDSDTALLNLPPVSDAKAQTLFLSSLTLSHFRNYTSARIEINSAPVVLTGRNGAGKTNILEAISLLTPGKGLRRAGLAEMDNCATGTPWTIAASVSGMQGAVKIGTGRDSESQQDKRIVKIDGNPARSQAELSSHIAILWLTPQMEQLFHEGASAGRKFLDRLVYSFEPEHASRVAEYEYAMRERNRLLQAGQHDANWLDALEQTMAETACAIAAARIAASANINRSITLSPLSFPKAQIGIRGVAEGYLEGGKSALHVEDRLKRIWAGSRREDAAAGRTLIGTHRSELDVAHVEKQLPASLCSTGEQKTLLLSILLAQARCGAMWKRVVPVLLLDEVSAHLDAVRRLELAEEICQIGTQTWMTGTDAALFGDLKGKAQFFQVDNGSLT